MNHVNNLINEILNNIKQPENNKLRDVLCYQLFKEFLNNVKAIIKLEDDNSLLSSVAIIYRVNIELCGKILYFIKNNPSEINRFLKSEEKEHNKYKKRVKSLCVNDKTLTTQLNDLKDKEKFLEEIKEDYSLEKDADKMTVDQILEKVFGEKGLLLYLDYQTYSQYIHGGLYTRLLSDNTKPKFSKLINNNFSLLIDIINEYSVKIQNIEIKEDMIKKAKNEVKNYRD